ncbi:MAG: anaerobic ribonucleoside-triphosphate reductase activating protein [Candidatus Thiodiazotropha sp. (ex Monitilora ramsayi)]|nr:anaerobic ribonucleoside-triphosphate reductase activating protein [Candidatus Thiodiazotropha sp. (ex Monitilora ramsayi)]
MTNASEITVGGLVPMTTVDYPDALSAVVFCQGCPLRCRYCHNADLLPRRSTQTIAWQEVLALLESRRGLLDAVVFSGGEPTQQLGLADAIDTVRSMGFRIGLHTAGIYPKRLKRLLPLLDWVGLDIKAMPEDYPSLTGMAGSGDLAWESARLLEESGLPHELRTTLHPELIPPEEQPRLASAIQSLGEVHHVWQTCNSTHCLDMTLRHV